MSHSCQSVGTCRKTRVELTLASHALLVAIKVLNFAGQSFKTLIVGTVYFKVLRSVTFVFKPLRLSPQASKLTWTGAMAKSCPSDSPYPASLSVSCALPSQLSIYAMLCYAIGQTI